MATMYNCEIRNFLGSNETTVRTSSTSFQRSGNSIAVSRPGGRVNLITGPNLISYIENLGYTDVELSNGIGISFFESGGNVIRVQHVFQDGTIIPEFPGFEFSGLESPLVDYYLPVESVYLSFAGISPGATVRTSITHEVTINHEGEGPLKLRTVSDLANLFKLLGFTVETNSDAIPTILCEESESGTITTTVVIGSGFQSSVVTNTITETISNDQFDALETKVQANTDWIAAQPAFWEQVVNSLNNNVNGALNSSAETRDLLVALQLSTIPNIESRLTALENE